MKRKSQRRYEEITAQINIPERHKILVTKRPNHNYLIKMTQKTQGIWMTLWAGVTVNL